MAKPTYHLHLDAAHLPLPLMEKMLHEGGFQMDDFPHQLMVKGRSVPARHMTKFLYAPVTSKEVKAECLRLQQWVNDSGFEGLIQCEYVMEETEWKKKDESQGSLLSPLKIHSRPLSGNKGDNFKKHELHLELNKPQTSPRVINALRNCGFQLLENEENITFTISGHSKEMLTIRKALKKFLKKHEDELTGKLNYEATAFWSLHGIESASLPFIAEQVMVLQ
jgi:hypothetical protein